MADFKICKGIQSHSIFLQRTQEQEKFEDHCPKELTISGAYTAKRLVISNGKV